MNYKKAIDFLFHQLPMYQRVGPRAIKKDLNNILMLMEQLGQVHEKVNYIHVAGTNGKGSVSHMIAGALQQLGLNVGLYTSPHYRDFRERVKINGELIPKRKLSEFIGLLQDKDVFNTINISFFEISVAMAFWYFEMEKVDVAVIEVGLGGRLDSTNIIDPMLSVITNIGYDHQQTLGDTLELIAQEKAGIIKSQTPVIIGEHQEEIHHVFELKAKQVKAQIYQADQMLNAADHALINEMIRKRRFPGPFIEKNFKSAYAALKILHRDLRFFDHMDLVREGLQQFEDNSRYFGRWHVMQTEPLIIADGAHNLEGLQVLFSGVQKLPFAKAHIILGMVNDKPLQKVLSLFPKDARYYFAKANIPRGKNAQDLEAEAFEHNLVGQCYTSVRRALSAARLRANEQDLILITGSIYTVAEVI